MPLPEHSGPMGVLISEVLLYTLSLYFSATPVTIVDGDIIH
jgi:hypothetical protein